jgi:hypothetical protein
MNLPVLHYIILAVIVAFWVFVISWIVKRFKKS